MTELMVDPEVAPTRRSNSWRRWAVGVVCLFVMLAGWFGWRWLHHPDPLVDYPAYGFDATVAKGRSLYVDAGIFPAEAGNGGQDSAQMTLNGIEPSIVENSSRATVEVLVCRRNPTTMIVGSQYGELSRSCLSVEPFDGPEDLELGYPTAQIVLQVTPRQPGTLRVAGLDVTYRQGLKRASVHSGVDMKITTPR